MAFRWSASRLYHSKADPDGEPPSTQQLISIIDELYDEWAPSEFDISRLHEWACERFGTTLDEISRDVLDKGMKMRIGQMTNLFDLVKANTDLKEDPDQYERVERIAKIIRETRNSLQATAILYYQMDDIRRHSIPEEWNPTSYFTFAEDEKLTNFQKLVISVLKRLASDGLRRLDDWVYEEVVIRGTNERSHAWKPVKSLKDYIYQKIQKETDYDDWKCLTNPPDNGDRVVTHLCTSVQQEFPIVDMNRYLWAYNNGLYNVEEDMFWPFQSAKISSVSKVTKDVIKELPEHVIGDDDEALDPTSAAVIKDGVHIWNIGDDQTLTPDSCFYVDNKYYSNFQGREAWPRMAYDITTYRRGIHIGDLKYVTEASVRALTPITVAVGDSVPDDRIATKVGQVLVWNVEHDGNLTIATVFGLGGNYYSNHRSRVHFAHTSTVTAEGIKALKHPPMDHPVPSSDEPHSTVDGVNVFYENPNGTLSENAVFEYEGRYMSNRNVRIWTTPSGDPYTARAPTQKDVAVKHFDVDFRFEITPETEETFDPEEIELPEMDRIMTTQHLDATSQTWLVLMLCRLFFPVGYDQWQVVLFIKGIAGSGKSTLAQIIRSFYPPARISTLSSNIEQKFGLSAIYKGLVCICAEVREDFGLDQAEWQSCVSGEEVQVAVKQKTAFTHKWDTPFFFLGNELPSYRNNSGSVDRRVFMIEFRKRVHNSDPKLFKKFMKNIDRFQRKGVALYHRALYVHGNVDIWAPGVVGTQIAKWRNEVKESSDLLHAFVNSGTFEFDAAMFMPLDDFKQIYTEFRKQSGHDKVKWTKDHYDTVFQDVGVFIVNDTREYGGARKTQLFISGMDLKSQQTIDDDM